MFDKMQVRKEKMTVQNKDFIPARYILTFLIFCGMNLIFGHRVCLNVAMVAMVNNSEYTESHAKGEESAHCPAPLSNHNDTKHVTQGPYTWSAYTQGMILSSYFYLYVVAQVIGGKMADYVGAKTLFGGATLVSSVLTCVTPTVASWGPEWLIALRTVLGFVHGMHYPSAYTLLSRWSPVQERGTHLSACVIGTHSGVVLSMSLTGFLCERHIAGGWTAPFYMLGSAGFVWMLLWVFLVFESPAEHPRISIKELAHIQTSNSHVAQSNKDVAVPWAQVFSSPPVWAATIAKFCGAWSFLCFQTKLPAYLNEVLHMSMEKNGFVNSILFSALCISAMISGKCSDLLRSKKLMKITTIRKSFETIALLGPAACLVAIPLAKCDTDAVVILLTSSMALFGLSGGGDVSVIVDMAPDFAGKIFGVSNAFASIPGILAPIAAGYFLTGNKGDLQQWTSIFYMSVGMYVFGAVVFLTFGSAETQPWGTRTTEQYCEKQPKIAGSMSNKDANILLTVPVLSISVIGDQKNKQVVVELEKI
ncbi:hypothetical protein JTE90_017371 [Oedothorax gibbosus]|uniref:Major facilitator superfamily (MFS) profile domain-containing protein n=1 Tax=Oedothorax gibbosus TaxID=931172 RepID=A0AAV6VPT5_9ARAC|nr:hypothetical protein JTE90_017371 [Oedothorax gibbosus]